MLDLTWKLSYQLHVAESSPLLTRGPGDGASGWHSVRFTGVIIWHLLRCEYTGF